MGGQIGYNLQLGRVVIGVEADYQWADIGDSLIISSPIASSSTESSIDSFATVRGRLGLDFGRAMLYVTVGYACADTELKIRQTIPSLFDETFNESKIHEGGVYGGGVEIAVTRNASAKAEFLHFDLGSGAYNVLGALPTEGDVDFETLRVGLNYKLGN